MQYWAFESARGLVPGISRRPFERALRTGHKYVLQSYYVLFM